MKTKQAAMEAARKKLGAAANEGVDFTCTNTGAGWAWTEIPAANEPAAKAKAKRAPKDDPFLKAMAPKPKAQKTAARPLRAQMGAKAPPKPPSPRTPPQVAPAAGNASGRRP